MLFFFDLLQNTFNSLWKDRAWK